ncbi:MAG: hypothetical protein R3Y11_07645 [Pseudomonadota bacterium]
MIDYKTDTLELPLPHKDNKLDEDVLRIITALTLLDTFAGQTNTALAGKATTAALETLQTTLTTALASKASVADVATQIAALVDSSPDALNTLNELAAALGDNPNFAATVNAAIATAQSAATAAQTTANTASTTANAALPKSGGTMTGGVTGTTGVFNSSLATPTLILDGYTITVDD